MKLVVFGVGARDIEHSLVTIMGSIICKVFETIILGLWAELIDVNWLIELVAN